MSNNEIVYREKAKFFISTKTELLEDKINYFLRSMENEEEFFGLQIISMSPFMSYAGLGPDNKGGYMIGCMVRYSYKEIVVKDSEE